MTRTRWVAAAGLGLGVAAALGFTCPFSAREQTLNLHGTVEIQEVRLGSKVGGRIKAVLAQEGATVEAGTTLVVLEAPELEAQKQQLLARIDAAAAQLDKAVHGARPEEKSLAAAAVRSAEARWRKLEQGYRTEEVEQARGELVTAQAELERASQAYERERALFPQATSKADFEAALASFGRAQGQGAAARAKLQLLTQGYRPEEVAEAKAELDRARANWDLVEAGSRAEDIAELRARLSELRSRLDETEAQLREAVVLTPERVLVEVVAVRPGDMVGPNQPVVRVLRAADVWIKAFVPETELGKVRLGQEVRASCDAYPDRDFAGSVVYIAATSEYTPRNVQSYDERRHQVFAIKVRLADSNSVFKSGMAANVKIPVN